jgi:hypothetical protein
VKKFIQGIESLFKNIRLVAWDSGRVNKTEGVYLSFGLHIQHSLFVALGIIMYIPCNCCIYFRNINH